MLAGRKDGKMRRYKKKSRHSKAKPSIVALAPLAVVAWNAAQGAKNGGIEGVARYTFSTVVPINSVTGQFDMTRAAPFYTALVGTYGAKKVIAMSGVNRAMKGLPFRL